MGISGVYAIVFLPLTPFAIPGIIVFGLGFCVLSPLLAFFCGLNLRRRLRRFDGENARLPQTWKGIALGVTLVFAVSFSHVMTIIGLNMSGSSDEETQTRAVHMLRLLGDREELLRSCYGRDRGVYNFVGGLNAEMSRTVYYRVYGKAFNSVPPPTLYFGRSRWNEIENEYTWDNDQAGDIVGGRIKGLSLLTSRQDGFVDAGGGFGYTEWTLEFKNVSQVDREARAQVELPPGGVVSRLTLWVNGEECEAAFGGVGDVKTAYKSVVQRRRDPVLVTLCGPDRVLVQCFPVPRNGGTMKVRLGMTAPLSHIDAQTGCLVWAHFIERNFTIPERFEHSLWMESSEPFQTLGGQLKSELGPPRGYTLRGNVLDKQLAEPSSLLRVDLSKVKTAAWTRDTREGGDWAIHQVTRPKSVSTPDRVVLVVDTSLGMKEFYPAISTALARLPQGIDFSLLLAKDGCEELVPIEKGTQELYHRLRLGYLTSEGGHDNVPALNQAWELAAQSKNGAIVWIHGPQPVAFSTIETLKQRCERSYSPPAIYDLQTQPGPNSVISSLGTVSPIRSVLRMGGFGDDLNRFFEGWNTATPGVEWVRERVPASAIASTNNTVETTMHLARLWAADEVERLIRQRQKDKAIVLAARYQLVTRVTGAVVLENKEQFKQAGLEAVGADTVPTVPEPSTLALAALGAVGLWLFCRKRRFVTVRGR
jgi:hypothetical protein